MPDRDRSPTYPNPSLPRGWSGGVFLGLVPPTDPTWYEERHADPLRRALDGDWAALEDLTEGDGPEVTGLDAADAGPGAGGRAPKRMQTLRGVVRRISATLTGLVLEEAPDEWLNVSRFGAGVSLQGYRTGDLVEVDVELGGTGKRYIVGLRRPAAEVTE